MTQRREYRSKYYSANRPRLLAKQAAYNVTHRKEIGEYHAEYYATNKKRLLAQKAAYHIAHGEVRCVRQRAYYAAHKKEISEKSAAYRATHIKERREYAAVYVAARSKIDVNFKLQRSLTGRLRIAIKSGTKAGSAVRDLGCSIQEFKTYIEARFQEGMSWENWSHAGWHIDHIKPLSSFTLTDRAQFLQACHYTNLQPLWSGENIRKSNKIIIVH